MNHNEGNGTPGTDSDIVRQVLGGNREQYCHLVKRHQNLVYAMIMRQVGDAELARELTQDTFVRAYRNLETFAFRSAFSTWLVRIALNAAHTYFSSKRYKEQCRMEPLSEVAVVRIASEEHEGDVEQELERMRRAIAALKPKYREVLVLHYLERKSYREIAALLALREGTVGSRIHTAMKELRKRYRRVR